MAVTYGVIDALTRQEAPRPPDAGRVRLMFAHVAASQAERARARPGEALVEPADVVMDRALTVQAPPEEVWPWLVQLGKGRAGWYLPRAVERFLPRSPRRTRSSTGPVAVTPA